MNLVAQSGGGGGGSGGSAAGAVVAMKLARPLVGGRRHVREAGHLGRSAAAAAAAEGRGGWRVQTAETVLGG